MRQIFISYSFSRKDEFEEFNNKLKRFLQQEFGLTVYAFVFDFKEHVDEKVLMKKVFEKIDESDVVMVELSNKSVGVGIEAGYAKAKGKTIIYLHKEKTELKQTMNGIADVVITYMDIEDLIKQISHLELLQG